MIDPHPSAIRLIATDLDGTLLRYDKTISPRALAAIQRAHDAGLVVAAATGRYSAGLPSLLAPTGIDYAIASNGAQAFRLSTGEMLFEEDLPATTACAIVAYLAAELPGVQFEAVRDHGSTHVAEPGYIDLVHPEELRVYPLVLHPVSLAELVSEPSLKLTVRHPSVTPDELLAVLLCSGLTGFHATTSGAPFLEVSGPGITKAHGLARLTEHLGIGRDQVLAVGDARNDVEMLEWSGIGVAMGNAVAEALAAADHTTASNDEDGFARAIERLLVA